MFALRRKWSASRNGESNGATKRPRRPALVETLEDRRLHSVTPGGEVTSFSWGVSQTGVGTYAQGPAQSNIIAVLIGL